MKKMKTMKYAMLLGLLAVFAACSEEEPGAWSGQARLNFVQNGTTPTAVAADTIVLFTFVFQPETVTKDTVWVEVKTMGDVYDYPRPLKIKQEPSFRKDAVAGVHYVGFDTPGMKERYVIPAGEVTAKLPVVLLRDQLGEEYFYLRIVFEANDYFLSGYDHLSHRTIRVSNLLSKPENWNATVVGSLFGTYSQEKHQFMLDVTGLAIDEDYIQAILDTKDPSYYTYLRTWYTNKLNAANALLPEEDRYKFVFNK